MKKNQNPSNDNPAPQDTPPPKWPDSIVDFPYQGAPQDKQIKTQLSLPLPPVAQSDPSEFAVPNIEKIKKIYGKKAKGAFTGESHDKRVPHSSAQKSLIDGLTLNSVKPHDPNDKTPITTRYRPSNFEGSGASEAAGWTAQWAISGFGKNGSGQKALVKGRMPWSVLQENFRKESALKNMENFTTAHREVAYYNLAHAFGLQKYVPTTAMVHDPKPGKIPDHWDPEGRNNIERIHGPTGNYYSVMEKIPDAKHISWKRSLHLAVMKDALDSGDLDKMAIMNMILGNTDRHHMNYMISPKGLHLIDHGFCFGHDMEGVRDPYIPQYLRAARGMKMYGYGEYSKDYSKDVARHPRHIASIKDKEHQAEMMKSFDVHPEALKWVDELDEAKIQQVIDSHLNMSEPNKKAIMFGLKKAKEIAKRYRDDNISNFDPYSALNHKENFLNELKNSTAEFLRQEKQKE
jgi:hypothetical protein